MSDLKQSLNSVRFFSNFFGDFLPPQLGATAATSHLKQNLLDSDTRSFPKL